MSNHLLSWRAGARTLLTAVAVWAVLLLRVSAADEPAAAPAAAPAPKPPAAGTWFVFTPPTNAEEVLGSTLRVKMLNIAKTFLERDTPALRTRLLAVENPFYAKQPPPPEPLVAPATSTNPSTGATSSGPAVPVQPVEPLKLNDADKLKAIGEKLQPTGILEGAGKRLVTFSGNGGGQLEVGKSFLSTVPPDTSPVTVQLVDANDTSCVLKLNNTTAIVEYVLKTNNPSRSPSSTPPSQPKP